MIPKKLHYCWFSGNPIPEEFNRYIETWKKFCPDYEIIRWDESNYDISKNQYMHDAYQEKRWGFVPDYARFDIVYSEGGIYLDTDVEVIRSLDDLLDEKAFLGFESENMINGGLMIGSEKENPVMKRLRDMYEHISFYDSDGRVNLTPSPIYISEEMSKLGVRLDNTKQRLKEVTIFPTEWFSAKDYYTGEVNITSNSHSIHHYSCTWMSRTEKIAEETRKRYCVKYGDFWGNRVDGITKRLQRMNSIDKINARKSRDYITRFIEHYLYSQKRNEIRLSNYSAPTNKQSKLRDNIVVLSPAAKTKNIGDKIIERFGMKELSRLHVSPKTIISTHYYCTYNEITKMKNADTLIVLGSNLLSGNIQRGQWKLPYNFNALRKICLLGCGWSKYEDPDDYSIRFYQKILSSNQVLHSVRDAYTEKKLQDIGIENVVNTGCPTMWRLTEEFCKSISFKKGNTVVTSLTSYQPDRENDGSMMDELLSLYDTVYFWPQGINDEKYLREIVNKSDVQRIKILKRDLNEYINLLKNTKCDYIGNRLHAGIAALNMGCRSLVIAIDNRAIEINRDTNLPMIVRTSIKSELRRRIEGEEPISIHMPWDNIQKWKNQFEESI